MRRMFSLKQLEEIASDQVKSVKKDISTLVDGDGHERFIEGEGTALSQEGVVVKYNRWSLSGTHLMCVLGLEIADTTSIADNESLVQYTFPEWIRSKIVGIYVNLIAYKTAIAVNTSWAQSDFNYYADKSANGLTLIKNGGYTASGKVSVRLSLDLLIDND